MASLPLAMRLCVAIGSDLSFQPHINQITPVAFCHLRNISKLRKMLSLQDTEKRIHAFITSGLNHCDSLFSVCTNFIERSPAGVFTRAKKRDNISPVLASLHWLAVRSRIDYKALLLPHKDLNGLAPEYLCDLIPYTLPQILCSQDAGYLKVPRMSKNTTGGRGFFYRVPFV